MATNDPPPPATRTYRVWADHVRRLFQDVEAPDPAAAQEIARAQPKCWENCFEVEDRDDYYLSEEVQDTETEEYHRVGGDAGDRPGTAPDQTDETSRLRVVVRDSDLPEWSTPHFAVAAMRPEDADEIDAIIADLEPSLDADRYAALFASAPRLRRASQELYDRLQDFLDLPDRDLPPSLVRAMDGMEAAWREADRPANDPLIDTPEDMDRRVWQLRLAADRARVRRRDAFRRYFGLHAEDRIRLALEILGDVSDEWDHDTLEHYPEELDSFDEFLCELGMKLRAIRWTRPGRSEEGDDA